MSITVHEVSEETRQAFERVFKEMPDRMNALDVAALIATLLRTYSMQKNWTHIMRIVTGAVMMRDLVEAAKEGGELAGLAEIFKSMADDEDKPDRPVH